MNPIMSRQIFHDIWIRWIPQVAKNKKSGCWNADISPNDLHDKQLAKALYILPDYSCVCFLLRDLEQVLSSKTTGKNRMIFFVINSRKRTVDDVRVGSMSFIESRIKRRREKKEFWSGF